MSPDVSVVYDPSRWIFYKLRVERNKHAIHNLGYELERIEYNKKNILYLYNYKQGLEIPELYETIEINYSPAQSRKCKYCVHKIKTTQKEYCKMKGKEITKHLNFKCLYWNEVDLTDGNLYIPGRPSNNGRSYRRVQQDKGF